MKFPVTIRHRSSTAKIYRPAGNFNYYRVACTVAGKRKMQTFATYTAAKAAAEHLVRDTANGSQAAALSASQSRDAIAALETLESFRQATGRTVSLLAAARFWVDISSKLGNYSAEEAIAGFLRTVVSVQRKDIAEAVEAFIAGRQHKTEAKDGKRAQLSQW